MPSPTNRSRTLLAAAGLLLIPAAALRVMFSPVHSKPPPLTPNGGANTSGPASNMQKPVLVADGVILPYVPPPPPPTPHVSVGAPAQAGFTLKAVTAISGNNINKPLETLTELASAQTNSAQTNSAQINPFLSTAGAGTGLWLKVRGGLGFQTLTIPQDGQQHLYHFGTVAYAVQTMPHSAGYSAHWVGLNNSPLYGQPVPYQQWVGGGAAQPTDGKTRLTLIPTDFGKLFHVSAQALTAAGQSLGGPVTLVCQPVNGATLFTFLPAAYSDATRQFRVTAARIGQKGKPASWVVTGLQTARCNGPDTLPLQTSARIGPFAVQGVAAEAEDTSGIADPMNQHSNLINGVYQPSPQNMDIHSWTGLPTLRFRLNVRAAGPISPNQSWMLQLEHIIPQWSLPPTVMPSAEAAASAVTPNYLPLSNSSIRPSNLGRQMVDGEVGIAYPRQQHWLKFDGTAIRSDSHWETITLHDAEVIHDAVFGGDRLVWKQPQAVTTPSGITVMVLNAHSGTRGSGAAPPDNPANSPYGSQSWWYDRGNAEMILAWKLPESITPGNQAKPDSPRVADLPLGVGLAAASIDTQRPTPYVLKINPPGGLDARDLQKAGYTFLRFSIWTNQPPKRTTQMPTPSAPNQPLKPEVLPPYSWREGAEIVTAQPLPRHLKTLTLQIQLHEIKQTMPFHLVVPVRTTLPPEIGTAPPPEIGTAPPPEIGTAPPPRQVPSTRN